MKAIVLALGMVIVIMSTAVAEDVTDWGPSKGRFSPHYLEEGTLGWAEYGLYPGLYGFSLRWHPGYGYGLYALGVGADGGYPFYGGIGYPHEPPCLNRCGPDAPYTYFGGPGYPIFGWTNFYQPVGGLTVNLPVVSIGEPGDFGYVGEEGQRNPGADFGSFTGAIPYPETMFAPYTSAAARTGSSGAESAPKPPAMAPVAPPLPVPGPSTDHRRPATNDVAGMSAQVPGLGVDEEPVVDTAGVRAMKTTHVYPGSPAERAGLRAGDMIHSINGYLTTDRGNVAWIIAVAAPDNTLKMNVRTASDGQEHLIMAELPLNSVNLNRPDFLPRVGNGPPPATR